MTDALDRRPGLPAADLHERIREVAFALLLTERRPIAADELATATGTAHATLSGMLDRLVGAGWIDRDEAGRVTGAAGLSLTTGPHRIAIDGTEYRTWCAYDSIGIAAALSADAAIETECAVCGKAIALDTHGGQPPAGGPERLWLASGGTDLRGDFCDPTVLLCSPEHAAVWPNARAAAAARSTSPRQRGSAPRAGRPAQPRSTPSAPGPARPPVARSGWTATRAVRRHWD